ncbi:MAG: molybdopterin synthase sulfur carrier subunit [Gammaproteobacteria bacterium]|nr:molybdopterin synthase sulfur carrier subunit [Gammaproteobacteria bacterium]MCH2351278.1 MoaD/ThiS family protein [Pseudomonadales bacterium]HAO54750.1 molybdopterin synthase sulfur carrier subunit [Gammaproteobacteria bacterium]
MKHEVGLSGILSDAADGASTVTIDAQTIRELLRKLVEQYPNMRGPLDEGIAVSIDGQIYRDNWGEKIPDGSEVFLMPRVAGG